MGAIHREHGLNYQAVATYGGPPDYTELVLRRSSVRFLTNPEIVD
jgi:hypothetical protein